MLNATKEQRIYYAVKMLQLHPKSITVRGEISTRRAAELAGMDHNTLNRSPEWKAALDDYNQSQSQRRPDTGANQSDVRADPERMDTGRA